ncbi:hypothetical protein LWC34_30070 [Kibdelosporangium philippinense]|uniref:Uncharacterized protein n=1 Tax=Kibdelosporangium philippinense TaxID=211113 RepID=A0ABS8ZJA7_9PSEU|nr:hypothetical protein [Kibdelosporangium philippinense]MCE7007045.1 hypothetical protein [Kibdelosporangium philippinense]
MSEYLRAGLRLVPPAVGWQHTIVAADVVLGDHGAVTGYSAAIGRPTLLATFPDHDVAPGSVIEALGKSAPHVDFRQSLHEQLHRAIGDYEPDQFHTVRELTSSIPDESARTLRQVFYQLMDLPEPDRAAVVRPFDPSELTIEDGIACAALVSAELSSDASVHVTRWPADVTSHHSALHEAADIHLVVRSDHPQRDLLTHAAILTHQNPPNDMHADQALAEIMANYPACRLAVVANSERTGVLRHRNGDTATAEVVDGPGDVALAGSAIHAWLASGRPWPTLPDKIVITHGPFRTSIQLSVTVPMVT